MDPMGIRRKRNKRKQPSATVERVTNATQMLQLQRAYMLSPGAISDSLAWTGKQFVRQRMRRNKNGIIMERCSRILAGSPMVAPSSILPESAWSQMSMHGPSSSAIIAVNRSVAPRLMAPLI